jgi:hypothetical protein
MFRIADTCESYRLGSHKATGRQTPSTNAECWGAADAGTRMLRSSRRTNTNAEEQQTHEHECWGVADAGTRMLRSSRRRNTNAEEQQAHEHEIIPRVSETLSAMDLLSQQSILFLYILITLEFNFLLLFFWSFIISCCSYASAKRSFKMSRI